MTQRSDDPRSPEQKKADADMQRAVQSDLFQNWPAEARRASIERARRKKTARKAAAQLGVGLSALRQWVGLSQEDVAQRLGTQRSAISRLESGRYGGLTIERFLLILGSVWDSSLGMPSDFSRASRIGGGGGVALYEAGASVPEMSQLPSERDTDA